MSKAFIQKQNNNKKAIISSLNYMCLISEMR